jgi:peptidoglycan hydrolase CwlO-like protein
MKFLNFNVSLTNRLCILLTITVLISTLVIASVWTNKVEEIKETPPNKCVEGNQDSTQIWIPTEEDIAYQDSMYSIIQNTQNDITDIKEDIEHIFDIIENEDGTNDSVRYVKGGKIDKRRNN